MNLESNANVPVIANRIAQGAIIISAGLAVVGVFVKYGFGDFWSGVACLIVIAIAVTVEIGASRLLPYAQARLDAKRYVAAAVIFGVFLFASWANVTAAHVGLRVLDDYAIHGKRGPIEIALKTARADQGSAEDALRDFDKRQSAQETNESLGLRKGIEAAMENGFGRAAARLKKTPDEIKAEAEAKASVRKPYEKAISDAKRAVAKAEADLEGAPKRRPDGELWELAALLEVFKGVMIWAAAGGMVRKAEAKPLHMMTAEELKEAASEAGRAQRLIRAENDRRKVPLRKAA